MTANRPLRVLFVKPHLAWPRSSGHDIHMTGMMRGLAESGHEVSLVTTRACDDDAIADLQLTGRWCLEREAPSYAGRQPRFSWLQNKFGSYWGVDSTHVSALGAIAKVAAADAVVVVGLDVLPYFGALDGVIRVWYPADEWVWHHLSLIKWDERGSWTHLKPALVKGVYERAYRSLIDRVWVVTETERRAMRWFAGMRTVDVFPLGIDGEHFSPLQASEIPRSAVFWGRLDFEPNIQALTWFCRTVWPQVRRSAPDARFTIVGFNPGAAIARLAAGDGISIAANLPDLRQEVSRHQLVVLPFVSGGGIKNKLLEAASLGRPIVCTPRAANGLRGLTGAQLVVTERPDEFARHMLALWNDDHRRRTLGSAAREWVLEHHGWRAIAEEAAATLTQSIHARKALDRGAVHAV